MCRRTFQRSQESLKDPKIPIKITDNFTVGEQLFTIRRRSGSKKNSHSFFRMRRDLVVLNSRPLGTVGGSL
ncbi:hypothetical protein Y032_0065g3584 [Ancylostoma ceylanicum]|uniref:Uncharacterized protein n=1 Tax=Ancylostoma ceylanicum TaxID=53326 RepID=A0A016U1M8_9BILA|nr:hypothetical protein Y032_0065g3584 [Ancylostoma ceylanicum]